MPKTQLLGAMLVILVGAALWRYEAAKTEAAFTEQLAAATARLGR